MKLCWKATGGAPGSCVRGPLTLRLQARNELDSVERGKRDIDCDKQIEKAVTAPNCVLKGRRRKWGY